MRQASLTLATVFSVAVLHWNAAPALAQGAEPEALSRERVAECLDDRQAEGCATVLVRVLVCDRAPELPGCQQINEYVDDVEREADDDVDVRAEGELAEPADDDENDGNGQPDVEDESDEDAPVAEEADGADD